MRRRLLCIAAACAVASARGAPRGAGPAPARGRALAAAKRRNATSPLAVVRRRVARAVAAPYRALRAAWDRWPPAATRALLTCSSLYCAFVAYEHDRDMAAMRRKLTDFRGASEFAAETSKRALREAAVAAAAAANATQTHAPRFWAAAQKEFQKDKRWQSHGGALMPSRVG